MSLSRVMCVRARVCACMRSRLLFYQEDARKFAETLRNIFEMNGNIDDVVTPGMIRSCNLVARGTTLQKGELAQIRELKRKAK